jgi:hypothetical protein
MSPGSSFGSRSNFFNQVIRENGSGPKFFFRKIGKLLITKNRNLRNYVAIETGISAPLEQLQEKIDGGSDNPVCGEPKPNCL